MNGLRAKLVRDLAQPAKTCLAHRGRGQRHLIVADVSTNVIGDNFAERGARRDTSPVVSANRDDIVCELVESGHIVGRHADRTVPLVLELDAIQLRK